LAAALAAPLDNYTSAQQKLARIESDQLPAGSRIELTAAELNAYVTNEAPKVTDGVRNPRLELMGDGLARGTALVDFARVQRSQGHPPGWFMTKLLEGERPVSVRVRVRSSAGQATVDVQRVEVSGMAMEGAALDFLIQHFLLGLYPNAVVGRPFALGHGVERVDVRPRGVTVVVGRERRAVGRLRLPPQDPLGKSIQSVGKAADLDIRQGVPLNPRATSFEQAVVILAHIRQIGRADDRAAKRRG
jgi:hypothetical protein